MVLCRMRGGASPSPPATQSHSFAFCKCCMSLSGQVRLGHGRACSSPAATQYLPCRVTLQTCLLCHTADMSAASHRRHIYCVTQQTCLLCRTAEMSAVSRNGHVCCVSRGMDFQSSFWTPSAFTLCFRNDQLPYIYIYIYIYTYVYICTSFILLGKM